MEGVAFTSDAEVSLRIIPLAIVITMIVMRCVVYVWVWVWVLLSLPVRVCVRACVGWVSQVRCLSQLAVFFGKIAMCVVVDVSLTSTSPLLPTLSQVCRTGKQAAVVVWRGQEHHSKTLASCR